MSKDRPTHHDIMALNRLVEDNAGDNVELEQFGVERNWSPDTGDAQRHYVFRNGGVYIGPRGAAENLIRQLKALGVPDEIVAKIFW